MLFTISFAIIGVRVAVAQSFKPDVCNPEYTPSIKCYPPGLGDGRPPCCELGYCKNGNYTNVDIICTSPSLCDVNNDPECYYFSGMPVCCTSELACSFTSNLECDTNKYKPQATTTPVPPTTLAPMTTALPTLPPVTATPTLPPIVTTTLPPIVTTTLPPVTTTLPPVTTTPVTTALATPAPEEANKPDDNTNNTLAKATKIFKNEKIPKADKITSLLIVDAKAEKMSVHHHEEAKAKTEKMFFDGKAEKKMSIDQYAEANAEKIVDAKEADEMSVHHEARAKTEKMFDGKAGKKEHSMSIHHEAKATKGLLVHDSVFQLRN